MTEYFVVADSFAAPFVSDRTEKHVIHDTPESALECFAETYRHPAGLYAASLYASADAYHKGADPLARWLCNHEIEKRRLTEPLAGYSYLGHGPGDFEINGVRHRIENPKGGQLIAA
jgi:hypothetical protein